MPWRLREISRSDHTLSPSLYQLRFCPGNNCKYVIKAEKCVHKRATCTSCKTSFCYQCGSDYHAPTDCETIKRWLTKCADDSETANYISAHTKDVSSKTTRQEYRRNFYYLSYNRICQTKCYKLSYQLSLNALPDDVLDQLHCKPTYLVDPNFKLVICFRKYHTTDQIKGRV